MTASENPLEKLQHAVALNKTLFIAFFLALFAAIMLTIKYTDPERANRKGTAETSGGSESQHGHYVPMMQNIGRHSH